MKEIASKDNKYIKLASKLNNKKIRDEQKMFLVEGKRAVSEALKKPELLYTVFIDESLLTEYEDLKVLTGAEVFSIPSQLVSYICATEHPQGVAAILKKPVWSLNEIINRQGPIVLLDEIADPGNMGSIIRTCWALGAEGILLTPACPDPFSPKVVRASMGGILNLPLIINVGNKELDYLASHEYSFMGADLNASESLFAAELPGKLVVVLGSEANGVSKAIRQRCDHFVKIPMNPKVDSLNVAAACAIIMAEVWRQRNGRSVLA